MAEFSADVVPLAKLFADPYEIEAPPYQRAFAWTWDEAGRLFEDLSAAAECGGEPEDYFLGTMLFIERTRTEAATSRWRRRRGVRALEVVDGFQRLTTLTILLCVLRDLGIGPAGRASKRVAGAMRTGRRPRLTLAAPDEVYFAETVRAAGATAREGENGALAGAQSRINEVRSRLHALLKDMDVAQRRRLAEFVLDRCCVVLVATTGIDRAHQMFMVLNATGKQLARNDVLKAALLGGAPEAHPAWADAEQRLGAEFEQLFSHIHVVHGRPEGRIITGVLEIADAVGGAGTFIVRHLQPASIILHDLRQARHEGAPQSAAIARHLRHLNAHAFSEWVPPAMLFWQRHGDDPGKLEWFLGALERLTFAVRLLGIGASKRAPRFAAVLTAIREGRDLRGDASPLALVRQEHRAIQSSLREVHVRNPGAAKLLLLRINDALAGEPQSRGLPADMSVEHVLPRKLAARCQWRAWFPNQLDRERCTESLGNLVVITKSQNDRAGNYELARKLDIYFNTPGAPLLRINEDLRGRAEWTPSLIQERESRMLQQVERLWALSQSGVPETFAIPGPAQRLPTHMRSA